MRIVFGKWLRQGITYLISYRINLLKEDLLQKLNAESHCHMFCEPSISVFVHVIVTIISYVFLMHLCSWTIHKVRMSLDF